MRAKAAHASSLARCMTFVNACEFLNLMYKTYANYNIAAYVIKCLNESDSWLGYMVSSWEEVKWFSIFPLGKKENLYESTHCDTSWA